jgi:beta-lactamase superfamily II metal-dependent hydrolase
LSQRRLYNLDMRRFLLTAVLLTALVPLTALTNAQRSPFHAGDVLPAWTPGTLDIHQLVTGRGNAAFLMFPDGTTLLIDAGDVGQAGAKDRTVAQVIARYVRHMAAGDARLDYAVITHFHGDHMGAITEVARELPISRLIDRGWPEYAYLPPQADALFTNYRRFVTENAAAKRIMMTQAEAGSTAQVTQLRHSDPQRPFEVRIVAVNDRVWTGQGNETKVRFPTLDKIPDRADRPDENMCSIALRIRYGPFSYFTGGDMPGYPVPGAAAWHDEETDVARAIGRTDVHVVNHHGSLEDENPFWLATLRSRVMIVPAWSATHPSPDVLKRMLSRRIYPEPRDIFVTLFREATQAATGPRAGDVASDHGHIVVRVEPGGTRYWVLVLDDRVESYRITSVHGPYTAG